MMAIMMYVTSFAQTTEHMKFKGVPMEGTLQTFTNKLKAKGFTPFGVQDGVSLLKGDFAGYKDCTVVAVADKSGMICKVTVVFPTMDKWGDLEQCYSRYKSMLSEKYGDPKDCVEKFQNDYINDDNGKIQLEITHQNFTCFVVLSYFDNANQEKLRQQVMDDL